MELLAPAGSLKKLKYALLYGADAVYTAGKLFGLRAKASNLDNDELIEATNFAHSLGKKIFVTVNIFSHNQDIEPLKNYLTFLNEISVDAIIVSDLGIFSLAKEYAPNIDIHISTQANVTSYKTVEMWKNLGAKRVILARELTIDEIKEIKQKVPDIELEIFVHGAMCMSYSGRCLLSAFLNGRSANRGECTQPCRWNYALIEQKRPTEPFSISEDQYGTYILNSKDLNLSKRINEILDAGIDSIKIEGRMKSVYYAANVTRIYRTIIDFLKSKKEIPQYLYDELENVSHRIYTEAFFDKFDSMETQTYETSAYIRNYQFIGEIIDFVDGYVVIDNHAKFSLGEEIELIFPNVEEDKKVLVSEILENDYPVDFTKPNTLVKLKIDTKIPPNGIVRKKLQ